MSERKTEVESLKENNKQASELQQEPKTYLNFYFFKISVGLLVAYFYMIASILINIVNRVVFNKYKYKFNFSFMLIHQMTCISFYIIISKNKAFNKKAGKISLSDFMQLKFYYLSFSCVFILNTLSSLYGNQLVKNTSMFLSLRKLLLVMTLLVDIYLGKKRLTIFTIFCVLLITSGSIISSIDKFSIDYIGYIAVMLNNTFTVFYSKMMESFKKRTGISNLKLMVYNSILAHPILTICIFASGEYKKIYHFFIKGLDNDCSYFGLFFYTTISCLLCVPLISSFFISNEKNSSLFTYLLSNSKDIITMVLSSIFLNEERLSFKKKLGITLSFAGALLISSKIMYENISLQRKKNELLG